MAFHRTAALRSSTNARLFTSHSFRSRASVQISRRVLFRNKQRGYSSSAESTQSVLKADLPWWADLNTLRKAFSRYLYSIILQVNNRGSRNHSKYHILPTTAKPSKARSRGPFWKALRWRKHHRRESWHAATIKRWSKRWWRGRFAVARHSKCKLAISR